MRRCAHAFLTRVLVASLFALSTVIGVAAAQDADGVWASPFEHPGRTRQNNAVYDPLHARLIVFGGSGLAFDQIWTLSLGDRPEWSSHRVSGAVPRHRMGPSAIFDPLRDRVIMFEGDEIWALSLTEAPTWTMLQAAGAAPSPRAWHSAVYDSKRDRMIVFGGKSGGTYLGDVWALDFANGPTWEQIAAPLPGPVPRWMHAATYDDRHDRMLVAVGEGTPGWLSDSWELELSGEVAWRQISSTGPPGRVGASLLYDPVHDQAVLLGGWGMRYSNYMKPWTDVWTLPAETGRWNVIGDYFWLSGSREYTYGSPAIYDSARRRIVAFGGTDAMMIPVLDFDEPNPSYSRFSWILPRPWPQYGQSAVYDPKRERMIMSLGWNQDGPEDQTWALSLAGGAMWSVLPTGGEFGGGDGSAILDPIRDRMIVFGGWYGTWELPFADPTWNRILPGSVSPPPRRGHSMIYDARRDRVIVFGGVGQAGILEDAFSLPLDGPPVWSPLPSGPPRAWHTAIYDPVGDRMLVLGGGTDRWSDGKSSAVWALSLSEPMAWSRLVPAGEDPPARSQSSAIYDPIRHRVVVHGGCCSEDEDGYLKNYGDTWELDLDGALRWRRMTSAGSPPSVRQANLVYDPPRDRMILYGGLDPDDDFPTHDEATALTWGNPVLPGISNPGDIVADTPVVLEYVVSNPLPGPRAIEWTLSSARDWPGFPHRGIKVVPGGSSETVRLELPLPDAPSDATTALTFTAGYSGAPGHVSVVRNNLRSAPTAMAIRVLGPAPSARLRLQFTLRSANPAQLELIDVAGRKLMTRNVGSLGAGPHVIDLSRDAASLGSGIYFVRLLQDGDEAVARAAVIR